MFGDTHKVVLVLDYGSQYTQLIARRVRELGLFSKLFPGDASLVRPLVNGHSSPLLTTQFRNRKGSRVHNRA
jgi:hypothetical protein